MGSLYQAMRLTRPCLVLLSFSLPATRPSQARSECCYKRVVTGSIDGLDGTFYYKGNFDGVENTACSDDCIYSREGAEGEEYCFKAVSSGAADISEECQAPPDPSEPETDSGLFHDLIDDFHVDPHPFNSLFLGFETFETSDTSPQTAGPLNNFKFESFGFDGFETDSFNHWTM